MSPLLLSLQNVSSRRWDRIVVEDLNWKFRKGECWGVIGPNGAGKTSLVGLIQDQMPYFRGEILRPGFPSGLLGIIKVSFEQQQKICFSLQHKQTGSKIFRIFKRHTKIIDF